MTVHDVTSVYPPNFDDIIFDAKNFLMRDMYIQCAFIKMQKFCVMTSKKCLHGYLFGLEYLKLFHPTLFTAALQLFLSLIISWMRVKAVRDSSIRGHLYDDYLKVIFTNSVPS